ncbi:MAG: hypothetical protein H6667_08105 [Ardenticatenaceae bacterium]|nr:hypothetical protein [Ardenticatenaceae bacterium]MCB9444683.1 hypothetical protein [Ardenticatenaceae bacterium]
MEYRIDGAVPPPSLMTSAKTFSLILCTEGLYVIHTGPDMSQKHSKLLTAEQISAINIKENLREIVLEIHSSQGKYKFRLPLEDKNTAETMKRALRP